MIRVAMLSFAHVHANGYAQQVVEHPEAEIQCIWEDDAARGEEASERFDAPVSDDLEAVVSRDDVDAVVINSYTSQHPWLIQTALRHNKHIFTEKALTISTEDAEEIVQAVNESDIKFMISLPRRTRSEILFLKEVLDKGWLGDVTMMRARLAHWASLDHWFQGGSAWFADAERAGGGALFDLGCHMVDVMRWFLGEPKSILAKITNYADVYDIDDHSVVVVEFKSGALGILETSWVHRIGPNPIEIYGTEGYVGKRLDDELILRSTQLEPQDVAGYIKPSDLPEPLPMPMDQWLAAILEDKPMTITVEDGRNLTELLEGAYESAETGCEYRF